MLFNLTQISASPRWLKWQRWKVPSVGDDGEPLELLVKMCINTTILENSLSASTEVEHMLTLWPSNSIYRYITNRNTPMCSQKDALESHSTPHVTTLNQKSHKGLVVVDWMCKYSAWLHTHTHRTKKITMEESTKGKWKIHQRKYPMEHENFILIISIVSKPQEFKGDCKTTVKNKLAKLVVQWEEWNWI